MARSSNRSGCIVASIVQVEDVAPPRHACQPVFAQRSDYSGLGIDIGVISWWGLVSLVDCFSASFESCTRFGAPQ